MLENLNSSLKQVIWIYKWFYTYLYKFIWFKYRDIKEKYRLLKYEVSKNKVINYISKFSTVCEAFYKATRDNNIKMVKSMIKITYKTGHNLGLDEALRIAIKNNNTEMIAVLIYYGAGVIHRYYEYNRDATKIHELLDKGVTMWDLANVEGIKQLQEYIKKALVIKAIELDRYLPTELVYVVMEYCL